jgi:hypothetical protein
LFRDGRSHDIMSIDDNQVMVTLAALAGDGR